MKRITLLLAALIVASPAMAAAPDCSWSANPPTTPINFGILPTAGNATGTSAFIMRCRPSSPTTTVGINRGQNALTFFPRYMKLTTGTDLLPYNLFSDAAATIVWGDTTSGGTVTFINPSPGAKNFPATIYGVVPGAADVTAGIYEDNLTVTNSSGPGFIETAPLRVVVTVVADCTVSAFTLDFGSYDPIDVNAVAPRDADAGMDVFCTKGTFARISLDNGTNYLAPSRRMLAPSGDLVNYQLYTSSARTTIWDTTNTVALTSTSKNVSMGFRIWGRIPAAQNVGVGAYADTIRATVVY